MKEIKKVFDKAVPICFAANSSFIPFTAVMIRSVIANSNTDDNYDIIILHTDVDAGSIEKTVSLADGHENVSVRFLDITEYVGELDLFTGSVYTGTKYSREAYYRLLIPSLMPTYDKVLYFDGDMVATSDVAELYHTTDMTGYMLASSRDYAGISNCYIEGDDRRHYRSVTLGIKNIDDYFISGMLIFNVSEFNKRYTGAELMAFCASREWRQHDQDVLNVITQDHLLLVDGGWDYLEDLGSMKHLPARLKREYEASAQNIKILHFAGPRKPWRNNKAFGWEHFWRHCYNTPFFGEIYHSMRANYGYKNAILELVTGKRAELTYTEANAAVYNEGYHICRLSDIYTKIDFVMYEGGAISIEGFMNFVALTEDEPVAVYVAVNGVNHECKITERSCSEYRDGRLYYRGVPFRFELKTEITESVKLTIFAKIRGNHFVVAGNLRYGPFCVINETPEKYCYMNGVIIKPRGNTINMYPAGRRDIFKHERAYMRALRSKKTKLKRIAYFLHKMFSRKKIWLIADRYNMAGDNGEALFKYLAEHKIKGVKPYFVISRNSADFKRMKKIGRVLPLESRRFRFMRVYADKILSAHCDNEVCYDYDKRGLCDLLAKQKIVFLQHGIIKDDLSEIYSRYKQNISLFVTSAPREYESIVTNENYGCGPEITKMTGLARYDYLADRRERLIAIIPTWRRYCLERVGDRWCKISDFAESAYYRFYSRLINDGRLLAAARDADYKILFAPHSLMDDAFGTLASNDVVEVVRRCDYSDVFSRAALLLTDYSSTAFDVAYLGKPVVYTQFDKEIFFEHQYSEGYFDYVRDGFGEVLTDYGATVDTLIEYIGRDCAIKPEYAERINAFFTYRDRENCKRIVDEILKLK